MQNLKSAMRPFGRSCSFVSGNTLASSTVPGGTNVAAGASFPSLSEPPQSTQTLGMHSWFCSNSCTASLFLAKYLMLLSTFAYFACAIRQGCLAGVCSGYLDVGTTFNRLVYVVRLLTHNGFYVLLDNQFNLDTSVLDNQNQWLSDWTTLLRAIAQDPISSQKLMIDVLNVC